MKAKLRTWEIARFIRGFVVVALMLSVLLQNAPSLYAAVPVYMVNPKSDPGNVFVVNLDETSFETFFLDLFNTLAKRDEDFTTSFELLKIEKAREDVNKLFQESLKELQDYGRSIDQPDPILGNGVPSLSVLEGGRIINNPYDYLFNEPIAAGRIGAICYYLNVIADQRGWLTNSAFMINKETKPKATFSDYFSRDPSLIINGGPSNPYTNQSVDRLWHDLATFLYSKDPGPIKRQEILVNEAMFIDDTLRNGDALAQSSFDSLLPHCKQILSAFSVSVPEDVPGALSNYAQWGLDVLKTFPDQDKKNEFVRKSAGLPTLIIKGTSDEQQNKRRQPNNTLPRIYANAQNIYNNISTKVAKINELSFVAGQGIRPSNLYETFSGKFKNKSAKFTFNTNYVISPAVILLQKMQAATQAEFDLAGQGFLVLDPQLKNDPATEQILTNYNVYSNLPISIPCPDITGCPPEDPTASPLAICNNPPEDDPAIPTPPLCLTLGPWLKPIPSFKTATLDPYAKNQFSQPLQPIQGGLPAPFEDEGAYVRLGAGYGGNSGYKIDSFRNTSTDENNNKGDNIGTKNTGIDFAINDWFDRVLEMYEPTGVSGGFSKPNWICYVETWLTEKILKPPSFGPAAPSDLPMTTFKEACKDRIPPSYDSNAGDGSY